MHNEEPSRYYTSVNMEIQRLLSWQDRERFSKTYGSFDRTYWCWKFTDFPGARFQEGAYALAYLFCHSFEDNSFAGNKRLLDWSVSGMSYWQKIQYKDGSFDEAYPFERSLASTAFTCFYVGEAFLLLYDHIPSSDRISICRTFEKAGTWLCKNDEKHGVLSNHLAAAAAALQTIYRICEDKKFLRRSRYFLNKIYDHQSEEGWYEEYGGADPGYQTHCTFYLAHIWKNTQDSDLFESLKRSLAFLKYFIHPNGTVGGEYGSRNTEFYFPAGFEILAPFLPDAALIAKKMRQFVAARETTGLAAMDAYNFLPMLNNYLFAADAISDAVTVSGEMPYAESVERLFDKAGLYIKSTPSYYAVLGASKGGVLKVFSKHTGRLIYSDCGYWGKLKNGKTLSSQHLNLGSILEKNENELCVHAGFSFVNQRVQTPLLFTGFRLFMTTFGRIPFASYLIKYLIVHLLISRQKGLPIKLVRKVRFKEEKITITDRLDLEGGCEIQEFRNEAKFSSVHMGSSRYFHSQELGIEVEKDDDWSKILMHDRVVERRWIVDLQEKCTRE